jgi:two-component system chemotaxis response regulator CheY
MFPPKTRILIVDDMSPMRALVKGQLMELGFTDILQASDGHRAIEMLKTEFLKRQPVELILCDWNMPVMNGMEFLLTLRARTDLAQPMVVFCTTENEFSKIQEALQNGANEYVMKPFDEEIIRGKLEQLGLI